MDGQRFAGNETTEALLLRQWLQRSGPSVTYAIVRAGDVDLVATILQQCPRARVAAILDNVKHLQSLEPLIRSSRGRATAQLAAKLTLAGGAAPDLIVLRSSGFEGRTALEEEMRDAHNHLVVDGSVLVVTHQKRGAARQLQSLRNTFGNGEIVRRGGGGFRLLHATRTTEATSDALATAESFTDTVLGRSFVFETAPTVFSKNRLDRGTRSLLEHLGREPQGEILDLGCGYGPIGVVIAATFPSTRVTMVDVNVRAVELAAINARLNGVDERTTALVSDGLAALPDARFDAVITHFPLHIPRPELLRLLREAHQHLIAGGRLTGVALRPYDVSSAVNDVFGNVRTIIETEPTADDAGYRVIEAEK